MIINSGNNRSRYRSKAISDINITPFVDVLLVLLIIFMVTSPIITGGFNVDLPNGINKEESQIDKKNIVVSIAKNGKLSLGDKEINISSLARSLKDQFGGDFTSEIHIKADKKNDYGKVMEVVKIINLAGFSKVILVTKK